MIPDLGTYSGPVLGSYAVGLALLAILVILSVIRARRVKRALDQAEERAKNG